jgi:hypothetical protein
MSSIIKVDNIQDQSGKNIINESSNTITLGASGDTIALASGASQTGFGRTGTVDWQTTVKTGDFTAVSGEGYWVNTTSGAISMTLPASPSAGAIVSVKDYGETFDTNNLTVVRNGSNFNGGSSINPVFDTEGAFLTFIYADATKGWLVTDSSADTTSATNIFISATGGTVKTCGNFKTHIFTGPGTFCVSAGAGPVAKVDYLVIAGGASGATGCAGGGGGAGGFRVANSVGCVPAPEMSPLIAPDGLPVTIQGYSVVVGAAGAATTGGPGTPSPAGNDGSVSTFSTITSAGGGAGGAGNPGGTPTPSPSTPNAGQPGGSAGGGGHSGGVGGTGNTPPVSPAQGTNGAASQPIADDRGGGGGGAGEAGSAGNPNKGGNGSYVSDTFIGGCAPSYGDPSPVGNTRAFAGGGGGASRNNPGSESGGAGGFGGGGSGGANANGNDATTNSGSGGGGASQPGSPARTSGAGGSGIVMIRYKFQ